MVLWAEVGWFVRRGKTNITIYYIVLLYYTYTGVVKTKWLDDLVLFKELIINI